jgi:hypothetical protein
MSEAVQLSLSRGVIWTHKEVAKTTLTNLTVRLAVFGKFFLQLCDGTFQFGVLSFDSPTTNLLTKTLIIVG